MARLQIEQQRAGNRGEPTPQLRVDTTNAAGEPVARGLQSLSHDVGQIAAQEYQKANAFGAIDLDLQFTREAGDLLYNSKNGYMTSEGSAALDTEPVRKKIDEIMSKYGEQASNPEMRLAFLTRVRPRVEAWSNEVEKHAGRERKTYYKEIADGIGNEAMNWAATHFDQPDEVEKGVKRARAALMLQWSDTEHLPPEQIAKRWNAFQAGVHNEVLKGYSGAERTDEAMKYLNDHKEDLGVHAAEWQAKLGKQAHDVKVETIGTQVWGEVQAAATSPVTGRFNEDVARAEFAKKDPTQRALIDKDFEHRVTVANHLQVKVDTGRLSRLSKEIGATGSLNRSSEDYKFLDDEGQARAEKMLETHRRQAKGDSAEARREQAAYDSIAIDNFLAEPDPARRAGTTDEEIDARFEDASDKAKERIKRLRGNAQAVMNKKSAISPQEFVRRVSAVAAEIRARGGSANNQRATEFRERMDAWYANTENLKDKDLSDKLGEETLQYSAYLGLGSKPAYAIKPEDRAGYTPLPPDQQRTAEAKRLTTEKAAKKRVKVDVNGAVISEGK
jgi:hypothetical protein